MYVRRQSGLDCLCRLLPCSVIVEAQEDSFDLWVDGQIMRQSSRQRILIRHIRTGNRQIVVWLTMSKRTHGKRVDRTLCDEQLRGCGRGERERVSLVAPRCLLEEGTGRIRTAEHRISRSIRLVISDKTTVVSVILIQRSVQDAKIEQATVYPALLQVVNDFIVVRIGRRQ